MPNQTGGVQAPDSYGNGANTNQGSGVAKDKKKRRRNGRVEYRWPNGTWHSRPFGMEHRSNYGDNGNGSSGGDGAGQGPSNHPFLDAARNEANLVYGGVESSLNQRGLAIPGWVQNYRDQLAAQQQASKNYAAPILQGAQTNAQQAGQIAPGVDPNSQAGQDAALAAAARGAMGDLFVDMLKGYGQIQNDYMTGRQTVATTAELGLQSDLARERTDLKREKGQYIAKRRGELKSQAHTEKLEDLAFGADLQEEANDQANAAADRKQDRNKVITSGPFAGMTNGEVRKLSPERKAEIRKEYKASGGSGSGGLTAGQVSRRTDAKESIRKGRAAIRRALEGKSTAPADFWRKAYNDLLDGGYDPLLAKAIVQISRDGKVKGGLKKRLWREYRIKHPGSGKPLVKPPAFELTPSPQAPAGGTGGAGELRPT